MCSGCAGGCASSRIVHVKDLQYGRRRHEAGVGLAEGWHQANEEIGEAKRRHTHGNSGGQEGRREGHIVNGADVFADAVNAKAATDGGRVVAAEVVSKADARLPNAGPIVVEAGGVSVADQTRQIEPADALWIEERLGGVDGPESV